MSRTSIALLMDSQPKSNIELFDISDQKATPRNTKKPNHCRNKAVHGARRTHTLQYHKKDFEIIEQTEVEEREEIARKIWRASGW